MLPIGTLGEIVEMKQVDKGYSVLVKGHHKLKLKSFIKKSIVDQIKDDELSSDKSTQSEISSLQPAKRKFARMKKNLKDKHAATGAGDDGPSFLVDTEKVEENSESETSARVKALTAELVKALSEVYFFNPLILYLFFLI